MMDPMGKPEAMPAMPVAATGGMEGPGERRRRMMIQMLQGSQGGGGNSNAWSQLGTALGGLVAGGAGGGMKG